MSSLPSGIAVPGKSPEGRKGRSKSIQTSSNSQKLFAQPEPTTCQVVQKVLGRLTGTHCDHVGIPRACSPGGPDGVRRERRKWSSHLLTAFTAASCTTAKVRNQIKCPSAEDWVKKSWHMTAMEFFIHKDVRSFVGKWIQPQTILLSEVSQFQKDQCMFSSHLCILDFIICIYVVKVEEKLPWGAKGT